MNSLLWINRMLFYTTDVASHRMLRLQEAIQLKQTELHFVPRLQHESRCKNAELNTNKCFRPERENGAVPVCEYYSSRCLSYCDWRGGVRWQMFPSSTEIQGHIPNRLHISNLFRTWVVLSSLAIQENNLWTHVRYSLYHISHNTTIFVYIPYKPDSILKMRHQLLLSFQLTTQYVPLA
jgi:hypothetical protein